MKRVICYETVKIVHPSKHKTLYTICTTSAQRRRRWADVVTNVIQMAGNCTMYRLSHVYFTISANRLMPSLAIIVAPERMNM